MTHTDTTTTTATTTTAVLAATVDGYLAAWTEPDPDRRAELVARAWAPGGTLVDPPLEAEGHEGLAGLAAVIDAHYPGHTFRRTSGIDAHHAFVRFSWELVGPDGAIAVAGIDIGELADDGRLRRITGFFGDLPPYEGSDQVA
jgi:hypothetical protein